MRSGQLHILPHPINTVISNWYYPFPVPLSMYPCDSLRQKNIADLQPCGLGNSQTTGINQFKKCSVPHPVMSIQGDSIEKCFNFLTGHHFRQRRRRAGRIYPTCRVISAVFFLYQEPEKGPQRTYSLCKSSVISPSLLSKTYVVQQFKSFYALKLIFFFGTPLIEKTNFPHIGFPTQGGYLGRGVEEIFIIS